MRVLRILHKWLGLIVGLQIGLWMASGLVFAWLGHADVAAEASVRRSPPAALGPDVHLAEPATWIGAYPDGQIVDIALVPLLDTWFYRVRVVDRVELRRADDGTRFAPDAGLIRGLAASTYAGAGALEAVSLQTPPVVEAREAGPVWRADFGDAEGTSLYFSAADGRLVAARNDAWRLFDFFWMMHTMDYRGRDDFNNPLVILFASGALWLGITGAVLLFQAFGPAARTRAGAER